MDALADRLATTRLQPNNPKGRLPSRLTSCSSTAANHRGLTASTAAPAHPGGLTDHAAQGATTPPSGPSGVARATEETVQAPPTDPPPQSRMHHPRSMLTAVNLHDGCTDASMVAGSGAESPARGTVSGRRRSPADGDSSPGPKPRTATPGASTGPSREPPPDPPSAASGSPAAGRSRQGATRTPSAATPTPAVGSSHVWGPGSSVEVPETPQVRWGHAARAANGLGAWERVQESPQETPRGSNVGSPAEDGGHPNRIAETPPANRAGSASPDGHGWLHRAEQALKTAWDPSCTCDEAPSESDRFRPSR